jgi:hypothetical protein
MVLCPLTLLSTTTTRCLTRRIQACRRFRLRRAKREANGKGFPTVHLTPLFTVESIAILKTHHILRTLISGLYSYLVSAGVVEGLVLWLDRLELSSIVTWGPRHDFIAPIVNLVAKGLHGKNSEWLLYCG